MTTDSKPPKPATNGGKPPTIDLSFELPLTAEEVHAAIAAYIRESLGLRCTVSNVANRVSQGVYQAKVTPTDS